MLADHSPLHHCYIPDIHPPVHARPHHCPCGLQRVHFLRFQQDQGTVCEEDARKTLPDGPAHVLGSHSSPVLPLHLRSR